MASDLPFDDEDEVAERGGDAAYRIASATARVARGGAYVTGGALVAANGGGVPASPGELDSRNAGWAHNVDPDPDVPSPVVTFPDPEPVAPQEMPFGSPGDASVTMPLPHGTLDIQVGRPGEFGFDDLESYTAPYMDEVPGLELTPGGPDGDPPGIGFVPGTPGTGVPESNIPSLPEFGSPDAPGGIPGFDDLPGLGGDIPGLGEDFPGLGNEGPGAPGGFDLPAPGDAFKTDIFDLPGFGLNPAGQVKSVAQSDESGPSGWDFGFSDLPGGAHTTAAAGGSGGDDAWFEFSLNADVAGGGGIALGGIGGSVRVESDMDVDISVGPGGVRVDSDWDFGITAEDAFSLDDQLDQYTGWMQAGAGTAESAAGAGQPGVAEPGRPADVDAAVQRDASVAVDGSTGTGTGAASAQNAAGSAGPVTSGMSVVPAAAPAPLPSAPAPMAVAPVAPPAPVAIAPVAPVVPAPVPPPVAPAAVAPAVQPVAATPLQTTVQPDAATSPVAHVFQPPAGPSPLTAPAAQLPDLFHRLPQPVEAEPPTEPTLPGDTTTVLPTTTAPVTTSDGVTTTPGATTTGPDGSTTTGPGATTTDGSTTSVDGSTTVLPGGTTSPQGSTTSPQDSTTSPQGGTTSPDGSTTTPELTEPTETGGSSPTSSSGEPTTGTEGSSATGDPGGVSTTVPDSSTGEAGSTTEPIGGDTGAPGTGGQTPGATPSTVDLPTQQLPTADQPAPQVPTAEQPQVPTVSVPSQQPSMPDAQVPTMPQQPMPTPLPAPQVEPIAGHGAAVVPYDVHGVATATPYTDHTVLGFAGDELIGGLSAGFVPHTVAVAEDAVPDPAFWVYF
ncbi:MULTISPECIES: hypothetical protein [Nocardia]|uniref:hypothetical protein n=1 Tax=Nocardia TaxID=1817 RepID=UPI001894135C|nr:MULTISPECIES: hypothetical protein [Nocardia]MBF6351242.1 hypothetical protein [Nocardia flavorosea]